MYVESRKYFVRYLTTSGESFHNSCGKMKQESTICRDDRRSDNYQRTFYDSSSTIFQKPSVLRRERSCIWSYEDFCRIQCYNTCLVLRKAYGPGSNYEPFTLPSLLWEILKTWKHLLWLFNHLWEKSSLEAGCIWCRSMYHEQWISITEVTDSVS